jgi:hypothetical protein
MKIKEVQTKKSKNQVNELKLSSFLGNYGDALARQTFGQAGGLTKQDIMASNIFNKNFISSALSNLSNGIKGGLIGMPSATPRPSAPQAPAPVSSATAVRTTPATSEPFTWAGQKYTKGPKGWLDSKGKLADANTAKILDRAAQKAAQPSTSQQPAATKPRVRIDPKTGQYAPAVTKPTAPAQPRQTVAQKAQTQLQKQAAMKQKGKAPFKKLVREEEIYDRLNFIIESIINEQDTYTIKDYLKTVWYPQFMKGVDYSANQSKIDQLLQQVEDTYTKDQGRAALTQLAQLSFAISPRRGQQSSTQNQRDPSPQRRRTGRSVRKSKI